MVAITIDGKQFEEIIKKYPAVSRDQLTDWVVSKCNFYNKKKDIEEYGFENGKKFEFNEQIKDSILLIDFDYEPIPTQEGIDKTRKKQSKEGSSGEIEEEIEGSPDDFTYIEEIKGKDGETKEVKRISIDKITDYLMEKHTFKTIYGTNTEKVFLYEGGIFILKGREIIKTHVEKLLRKKSRTNIVNEVFEKIKRKTAISTEEFHYLEEGLVCLENGVYDLREKKLMEHSPEYYFKSKLPIFYDTKADCPEIKNFFDVTLYKEDVPLMQEWLGFNLYNRYFEKKAIIFYGEKDSAKTITLSLMAALVGEKNKVSLSLQKIAYGKTFDLLDLKDKLSNLYDDLGDRDINDTGGFKIATGGGTITGEQKFGDRISFLTFAKLTFATNKIPAVKDIDDDAYYSRWMPIAFDNQIQEKNQDKFLLQKLTTKEEISGLFNWAVKGLNRLLKNNRFSFNKTPSEVKQIMQRSSHPLSAFAQDCLVQDDGEVITKQEMYEIYSMWCKKNDRSRFTKEKLGRNLERFVPYLMDAKRKQRVWLNVKFSDKIDDLKATKSEALKGNESETALQDTL